MKPIKFSFFLLLYMQAIFSSCRSQSKTDIILSKTIDSLNITNIKELVKSGYLSDMDAPLIATYMFSISQDNNTKNWTIKQLLDSVKTRTKHADHKVAIEHNYGKDSVFIRRPNGNKVFIGMGELSFEKMIDKASLNLPENYKGDYNLKINSSKAINLLSVLVSDSEYPLLIGNVLLYKKDNGQLINTKIGDLFEVSKRIAASKEFAPFISVIK